MYIYEMKKERSRLTHKITALKLELEALPNKNLLIVQNGKYRKWYIANGKNPIYIRKSNRMLAEQLALRKAKEFDLQEACRERNAIDQYLKEHDQHSADQQKWFDENPEVQNLLESIPRFSPNESLNEYLQKWLQTPYETNPQHQEKLIFRTLAGDSVRSKSEVIIANALHHHGIPYRYECAFRSEDMTIYPDFTICHPQNKQIFYWEHFGMMDLSAYANRAFEKLKMYASCQVIPTINLLTTYETAYHPLDCEQVENIIKETFL